METPDQFGVRSAFIVYLAVAEVADDEERRSEASGLNLFRHILGVLERAVVKGQGDLSGILATVGPFTEGYRGQ